MDVTGKPATERVGVGERCGEQSEAECFSLVMFSCIGAGVKEESWA